MEPNKLVLFFTLMVFAMPWHGTTAAQETPASLKPDDKFEVKQEIYFYQAKMLKIRDPFKPLTGDKTKAAGKDVPPQQMYDLSQMRLFAVVLTEEQQYAMVLLPDGKYYTIRKGDKLGLHDGYVTGMELDNVRVLETIRDYKNREIKKESFLRLRQEEGE
jgi:Tfp pilus assembly protein PilP